MSVWDENERMAKDHEAFWSGRAPEMGASGYTHLDVQVIRRETEKAFQVILEDGSIHWLPKSMVLNAGDYKAGDRDVTLSVPDWLAEEKGLA